MSLFKNIKIKQLKLSLLLISVFVLFISSIFIFFPFSWQQIALALTGNYNKNLGDSLDATDWNNLDDDFVAKSGDTMQGILNMGGKNITNLADPVNNGDAVNKDTLDSAITSIILDSADIKDLNGSLKVFCGRTAPGATNWINNVSWYVDIDISAANFTEGSMPYIFTSLGGLDKHWFSGGVGNISSVNTGTLNNLDDVFRVHVFDFNGISFATMLTLNWYINWCALGI
ncbi:hypothetical protein KAJ61_00640 [Candidatus Parcubacteria bacterium]|nr:hypothetical protein [Candidatus Parcubacteria bacterium]